MMMMEVDNDDADAADDDDGWCRWTVMVDDDG